MLTDTELEKSLTGYRDFLAARKTVVIATKDETGEPFQSIAPFVVHDGALYVYVSEVADHYRYLRDADTARVMIHGDESTAANIFGVERASFVCDVEQQPEDGNEDVFEKFGESTNPKMVQLLRGLDFHLFRLTPRDGRYVVGFGKAFEVSFDGSRFEHVVIDKKPGAAQGA
ncbi:heme iron utilization protein [Rhodococcus spelaei]|uniref:Heme iron utilization protein n=1 Tax=Rhodococcus spelaei TaxID=2546320 RepID=A0A541BQR4_9NOCA|nr:pyridoxamine 5'-phosphate oxidase family protein [Rhodococcus spelaei]TQF74661.1 heme iron utilization protein [Rhodococcus spelaei]